MGYYFEKVSKNLIDSFRQQRVPVSVWNGQKVTKTTSDKLAFSFSHDDVDDLFAFSSVTYILTHTQLFKGLPTIYSGTSNSKLITYVIPVGFAECFEIENGPNVNRIICLDQETLNKVVDNVIPVI